MDTQKIIAEITQEVKDIMGSEGTGHDWWHIYRVLATAKNIGQQEKADMLVVELAALLHDIADWKFHEGDDTVGPKLAREILTKHQIASEVVEQVGEIIEKLSFKGAGVASQMPTIEGKVVQDADRLDAMGAIGVARAFAYGGHAGRPLYDPDNKPVMHQTKEDYYKAKSQGTSINHFYEKLLLLKDRMNTEAGKKLAQGRHKFLQTYLDQFFQEWEGKI
ncbi:MAG: HD domain-containing protein [Candidatus Gribaldobacteria bacterium]|nr:HD domain-containing protein [Candidatus Gribaldobacteria bacterium]